MFNDPLFWGPILIVSLQKLGHMSLPSIYYMESVVVLLCLPLDIPAGALGDLIGRKPMIIIGRILYLVSIVLFAFMSSPFEVWTANILCMAGVSFQRGSDDALLFDSLKASGREEHFEEVQGKAFGNWFAIAAVGTLVAGIIADPEMFTRLTKFVLGTSILGVSQASLLRLALILCIPFMGIPLVAALFFEEPPRFKKQTKENKAQELKEGVRLALRSAPVLWMIGFAALLNTTSKLWFFTYNPYFELVHLPVVQYGIVFCLLNVVAWLSSRYASRILKQGERWCIIAMVACLAVPIIVMGLVPVMAFAYLVLIQNVVRGFMNPFVTGYLNRHVESAARATVLSVQSTTGWIVSVVGLALFGLVTSSASLRGSLIVLGFSTLVLGLLSYLAYIKKVET